MSKALVSLEGVRVAFGPESVLAELSVELAAGEAVAVLGPSGAGKSTLLKVVAGQQAVSAGRVRFGFDDAKPGAFGFVSQSNSLLPWLSVRENVAFPLTVVGGGKESGRVDGLLEEVGLEDHGHKLPREISGGMARRAVLARALVCEPLILLLDEPFGGLDAALRYRLTDLLLQVREKHGFAQVLVEHDVEAAAKLSSRFWLLDAPGAPLRQLGDAAALRAALSR